MPKLKNHKVYGQLKSFEQLMPVLYKRKSIYFAPADMVLPTAFFMGWSWMSGATKRHMDAGSFWEVDSYDRISRDRIRSMLCRYDLVMHNREIELNKLDYEL